MGWDWDPVTNLTLGWDGIGIPLETSGRDGMGWDRVSMGQDGTVCPWRDWTGFTPRFVGFYGIIMNIINQNMIKQSFLLSILNAHNHERLGIYFC